VSIRSRASSTLPPPVGNAPPTRTGRRPHSRSATPTTAWSPSVLIYTPSEWEAFVEGVRDGEFDIETWDDEPIVEIIEDDEEDVPASK
jgi:hypothetical protein